MTMDVLGIIPARGSSQGIPRKNIKSFCGKPLLAWTLEAAQASGVFRRIVLSTDDQEIAQVGRAYGAEVPFLRPRDLADDVTPTAPVVRHAVEWLRDHEDWMPGSIVVLEPTSPARRAWHIREAVTLFQDSGADSVASITQVPHHYVPTKVLQRHVDGTVTGIDGTPVREMVHRRQDLPASYALNGLLFACQIHWILRNPPTLWGDKVLGYMVDPTYHVDLDRPEDWAPAEVRFQDMLREEGPWAKKSVLVAL